MWPFLCWEVKWWLLMLSALNTCLAPRRSPGSPKGLVTIKLLPKSVPESGLSGPGMRRTVNLCVFRRKWVLSIFVLLFLLVFLRLFCSYIRSLLFVSCHHRNKFVYWTFSHFFLHSWICVWRPCETWHSSRDPAPDRKCHGKLCYDSRSANKRKSSEFHMRAEPLSPSVAATSGPSSPAGNERII